MFVVGDVEPGLERLVCELSVGVAGSGVGVLLVGEQPQAVSGSVEESAVAQHDPSSDAPGTQRTEPSVKATDLARVRATIWTAADKEFAARVAAELGADHET